MKDSTRIHYANGSTGKVIAARLLPGTDLMTGIEELCSANDITYAQISTCFGSFQKSGFFYLVPVPDSKLGAGYGELISKEGPIEFLNGTGLVCQRDSEYEIHLHGTMCDQQGTVFGGHLVKGENPVYTVDLLITEIQGMELLRQLDAESGVNQFYPVTKGQKETAFIEVSKD
ncbi:PPC domain-containing DNA-binding protein [Planococcus salinus]|uniref:DUF296 domain-containing protein n=1 Tax=Planococcus salinus TaxID=1848460 RepID=A0A3M8P5Z6_9BACL|nr:DUF296 domain-containing protein [Planococcus salinus]RNF39103.1 DUF296 domain-containing protein [Planococcus salinus]